MTPLRHSRWSLILEWLLCLTIVVSVIAVYYQFKLSGFLPQPYFYEPNDTFQDWFNPALYANQSGAYDPGGFESVYPPISFVFLRIFSTHYCYSADSDWARNCDKIGQWTILTFFFLNGLILLRAYFKTDRSTALPRTISMWLGLPMLYCLERGNLVIVTLTAFMLAYGPMLKSALARWIALAVAINFKPYLLVTLLPQVLRRRWRWLEGAALATVIVYLLTLAVWGDGTPLEVIRNTIAFSTVTGSKYWNDIYNATTYASMARFLTSDFPLLADTGSTLVEVVGVVLPLVIHVGQLIAAIAFLAAWLQPGAASTRRLVAIAVAVLFSTTEPSGYAEVFLLYLVFFEPLQGAGRIVAVVSAYLLCVSADYVLATFVFRDVPSWLGGRPVHAAYGVAVGQFVRPGLLLAIQIGLSANTIAECLRLRGLKRPVAPPQAAASPA